jgi:hypothetical protein
VLTIFQALRTPGCLATIISARTMTRCSLPHDPQTIYLACTRLASKVRTGRPPERRSNVLSSEAKVSPATSDSTTTNDAGPRAPPADHRRWPLWPSECADLDKVTMDWKHGRPLPRADGTVRHRVSSRMPLRCPRPFGTAVEIARGALLTVLLSACQ